MVSNPCRRRRWSWLQKLGWRRTNTTSSSPRGRGWISSPVSSRRRPCYLKIWPASSRQRLWQPGCPSARRPSSSSSSSRPADTVPLPVWASPEGRSSLPSEVQAPCRRTWGGKGQSRMRRSWACWIATRPSVATSSIAPSPWPSSSPSLACNSPRVQSRPVSGCVILSGSVAALS